MTMTTDVVEQIFTTARTHRQFLDTALSDEDIKALYDLTKFVPTASNLCPMRVSFVRSTTAKDHVIASVAEGNKAKVQSAAVTAIIAYDSAFANHIERLAPHMDGDAFRNQPQNKLDEIASENTWLYAGFFIAAARAIGFDCGPMSGFDKAKIDDAFYGQSSWRSALLMNLGHGDPQALHPRGARLSFEDSCEIL